MDWISLLQTLGGIIGGIGIGVFTKSGRTKAKADAMKAMSDVYEARLASAYSTNKTLTKTEKELTERIAELNHDLNKKSDEISEINERKREIADRLYISERETNRVNVLLDEANKRIIQLTEELAKAARLELIRCHRIECGDRLPSELVEKLKNFPRENLPELQQLNNIKI